MSSTETTAAPGIRQLAFGDLEPELATTRRLLERVPGDKLDWKPHEKSFSLGQLAHHVARLSSWVTRTLQADFFDVGAPMPRPEPPRSTQELLDVFDETTAEMRQALAAADDALLMKPWEMRHGDRVIQAMPKAAVIRTVGINHIIHHRGQLTVYLRLLNVPLPMIYGPSADERGGF
jgi:uncharacterized damage-inducible protein DinB